MHDPTLNNGAHTGGGSCRVERDWGRRALMPCFVFRRVTKIRRGSKLGYTRCRFDAARADDGTLIFSGVVRAWSEALARRRGCQRATAQDLAIQALAGSETVSDLAARHGVSRKFVYEQTHKARTALDDAFLAAAPEDEALFELTVTKAWLRQVIVALPLICHASYRGVIEFMRDLLGVSISVGTVHNVLQIGRAAGGRHQPGAGPVRHSRGPAR